VNGQIHAAVALLPHTELIGAALDVVKRQISTPT
jgi:hypothetical protein